LRVSIIHIVKSNALEFVRLFMERIDNTSDAFGSKLRWQDLFEKSMCYDRSWMKRIDNYFISFIIVRIWARRCRKRYGNFDLRKNERQF
jgi:hypothetical protein